MAVTAYASGWISDQQLYVVVTDSQSIENNTTTATVDVYLQQRGGRQSSDFNTQIQLYMAGILVVNWQGYASYPGTEYLIATQTRTYTHFADGTSNPLLVAAGIYFPTSGLNPTISFNHPLATIPRATTPTWANPQALEAGTAKTIQLLRASAGFTHDVSYKFGASTGTIATGAGVSTSWTPPLALLSQIPNAASGTGQITVVTKQGATVIGTRTVSFTLVAPASVKPTVSQVLWDDANPTVKSAIGAFVQGLSLIKGAVTAAGVYGSTITEKRLKIGAATIAEGAPVQITQAGTVTASGEATDSRGRVGSLPADFGVLAYEPPKLGVNGWQVRRANSSNVPDDNGQYLRLDLHASAASLIAGTEKNALHVSVSTRPTNGAWTTRNSVNPGLTQTGAIQISGGAVFLTSQSYEVEVTLSDNTGTVVKLATLVGTAVVTLDLRGNKVGVGKMHERGGLDVAGEIYTDTALHAMASPTSEGILLPDRVRLLAGSDLTEYGLGSISTPYGRMGTTFTGTTAQRTALTSAGLAVIGMRFFDEDDGIEYLRLASTWKPLRDLVEYSMTAATGYTLQNGCIAVHDPERKEMRVSFQIKRTGTGASTNGQALLTLNASAPGTEGSSNAYGSALGAETATPAMNGVRMAVRTLTLWHTAAGAWPQNTVFGGTISYKTA